MNRNYLPQPTADLPDSFFSAMHQRISALAPPPAQLMAPIPAPLVKELQDALYALKRMMMRTETKPRSTKMLRPEKISASKNTAPDSYEAQVDSALRASDIPAALRAVLTTQVRISGAAAALSAALQDGKGSAADITAAAWDLAGAAAVSYEMEMRLSAAHADSKQAA